MTEIIAKVPIQDTRLFYKKWDNFENLNNLLKTEIEAERKKDPKGLPATNAGCWRSMMKYKCEAELMKPIGMILSAYMDHYFPQRPMDAAITYWTNVNEVGSNNIFHSHYRADADLSGVYYVQGFNTGVIRFATHEQMYKMIPDHMPHSNMMGHAPSDGDVLCFPSYLLHDVDVNRSNRQRITIAFNAKISFKKRDNIINMPDRSKNEEK